MKKIVLALSLAALAGQLAVVRAETPAAMPPYLSGGIGLEEQEMLKSDARKYNLHLYFAEAAGAYLASVHVTIDSAAGTRIMDIDDVGPWFYAALPPGRYRITATYNGQARTVKIAVGRRASETYLYWR